MTDLTEGQRIYAIGDIHGRLDLLQGMLERINADLKRRPHDAPHVIFLGDYCDRGPDTPGVLDTLIEVKASPLPTSFLFGNHDNYILEFLKDPSFQDIHLHWFDPRMGGGETLASYGVDAALLSDRAAARDAFAEHIPLKHLEFLDACDLSLRIGGYIFAHAGIRPGVAFEDQVKEDLIWIREPFLSFDGDLGAVVVHGHTIVEDVQHYGNRIAVDTGSFRTNVVSCVVLEGASVQVLEQDGLRDPAYMEPHAAG